MRTIVKKFVLALLTICVITALGCHNRADKVSIAAETSTAETGEAASKDSEKEKGKASLSLVFSKKSGAYGNSFNLVITSDEKAKIYYTTDGSSPVTSTARKLYDAPIRVTDRSKDKNIVSAVDPIKFDAANVAVNNKRDGFISKISRPSDAAVDKCTVIKAVAQDEQGQYTDVMTNTYFIGSIKEHITGIAQSCKASGKSLAIISLSMDYRDLFDEKTGIYVKGEIYEKALEDYLASGEKLNNDVSRSLDANYKQKGREWERNVHMDYFESDGVTVSCGLAQDCGIRIQGNYSRSDLQKSFHLYAREDYGEKSFQYPFFGEGLKNDNGETITKFKNLTLRNGGNCAFTTKFSDTYWQSLLTDLDCDTQASRPCVVYLNGEYWGLYVLQEDYTQDYFEKKHAVNEDDVVLYKGDAEALELGYKLDLGDLPEGVEDESYYFKELTDFFNTHKDLTEEEDFKAFAELVDTESVRDYFAAEIWINNKWDWPGKNWSMWKTSRADDSSPYADGRWRFCFYDVEFGGVSGSSDAYTNTIREDNYKPNGLLDMNTANPAVLCYAYLMTNEAFREDFSSFLRELSLKNLNSKSALAALDVFKDSYNPLYEQFFKRYPGTGSASNSINGGYASYKCIRDFISLRSKYIQPMIDYVNEFYGTK